MTQCDSCKVEIGSKDRVVRLSLSRELDRADGVEVEDAEVLLELCERCAKLRDFDRLAVPVRADLPPILDRVPEALGEPASVLHNDGPAEPHVDVFLYRPETVLPGWCLLTVGRSDAPVNGARVELLCHLPPTTPLAAVSEAAEALRRVALGLPVLPRGWSLSPLEDALPRLRSALGPEIGLMKALYRAG